MSKIVYKRTSAKTSATSKGNSSSKAPVAKKRAPKRSAQGVDRDSRGVASDFTTARELYDTQFNKGSLPRLNNPLLQEEANQLSILQGRGDPSKSSFAGRRSLDVSDFLGRLKNGLDGYSSAENQAMREKMAREVDTNLEGDLQNVRATNAGNMVLGSAATAREDAVRAQAARAKAGNEQDLFIQDADEKQKRLNNYGQAVQGAESNEYQRGSEAISQLGGQIQQNLQNSLGIQQGNIDLEQKDRNADVAGVGGIMDIISNRRNQRQQQANFDRFNKNREI